MSKTNVHMNSAETIINPFAIGFMVNPTLYFNKAFRYEVEKCSKETFYSRSMSGFFLN